MQISKRLLVLLTTLGAATAFAGDCAAKAAKATQNCQQACAQMKKSQPDLEKVMKNSGIKDCDAMCKMAEDSAKASCLQKESRRKR